MTGTYLRSSAVFAALAISLLVVSAASAWMPPQGGVIVVEGERIVAMGPEAEVGTLAEGKVADIIAVRGDVLRYPSLLHDVDVVMHRGRRVR